MTPGLRRLASGLGLGNTAAVLNWLRHWLGGGDRRHEADLPTRLQSAIVTVAECLNSHGVRHALIGGVGMSAVGVPRSTVDVDFLVDSGGSDVVDALMRELGAECLQRTDNVANYVLGRLRIDFLWARRSYTQAMLERATQLTVRNAGTACVWPEDLIGLKLQAVHNDPRRSQDREDIRAIIRARRADLDEALLREYFTLFHEETWLDELLAETDA